MCTGKKTRTESLQDTRGEERGLKAAVLERHKQPSASNEGRKKGCMGETMG